MKYVVSNNIKCYRIEDLRENFCIDDIATVLLDNSGDFFGWLSDNGESALAIQLSYIIGQTRTQETDIDIYKRFFPNLLKENTLLDIALHFYNSGKENVSAHDLSNFYLLMPVIVRYALPNEREVENIMRTLAKVDRSFFKDLFLMPLFSCLSLDVDLGLPSGILWSNRNVGAMFPEEEGDYYAWAEIEKSFKYTEQEYALKKEIVHMFRNNEIFYSNTDKISNQKEFDVTTCIYGIQWKMPSKHCYEELINNCYWEWINMNGKEGYKVSGQNGNFIFLPAAGFKRDSKESIQFNKYGYYWTEERCNYPYKRAYQLSFNEDWKKIDTDVRYCGNSIRGIAEKNVYPEKLNEICLSYKHRMSFILQGMNNKGTCKKIILECCLNVSEEYNTKMIGHVDSISMQELDWFIAKWMIDNGIYRYLKGINVENLAYMIYEYRDKQTRQKSKGLTKEKQFNNKRMWCRISINGNIIDFSELKYADNCYTHYITFYDEYYKNPAYLQLELYTDSDLMKLKYASHIYSSFFEVGNAIDMKIQINKEGYIEKKKIIINSEYISTEDYSSSDELTIDDARAHYM